MSNATPELYKLVDEQEVTLFEEKASQLIVDGFQPLGAVTTHQVGANVTYLQAFWRPNFVAEKALA